MLFLHSARNVTHYSLNYYNKKCQNAFIELL